ncbi:hlh-10 [Pristionchus pacificus]|uniref:Hlh-10 n=1 Tax=Pristionchus pacificus TaxID=54126 RepID=A0A2A6CQ85_PRIPA|nr:hlh-10 [Pristionchus pacificus]|eukprot:PDM80374.1 hlh-10 [Pristionchus pacificus]
MCSVLPLKKRQVATAPLDLSVKKKKSTTPERALIPSPPTSNKSMDGSTFDVASLPLDMQLQLIVLSQQFLAAFSLPSLVPTPLPIPLIPTVAPTVIKVPSPKSLPLEQRKHSNSSSSKNSSPMDDKRCEANARERNRVQNLGVQFEKLRTLLPIDDQRLSKLTILKVAKAYIAYLAVLSTSESDLEMEAAGIVFKATAHQEMQPRR